MRLVCLSGGNLAWSPYRQGPAARRDRRLPGRSSQSSWNDLLAGVSTKEQWTDRRGELKQRYLELIRDAAQAGERCRST